MMAIKLFKALIIAMTLAIANASFATENHTKSFIFFYSSNCEYCHEMADILVKIRQKHKIRIIANSLDGKKIVQFPDAIHDNNITTKFKILSIPTIVAVDMNLKQFEVITVGLESEAMIEAKILAWINNA